jgi:3-hydroxybutyryl-CoA dehydratase
MHRVGLVISMPANYFEDFGEGDTFTTASRTITEADVMNFAGVSGDFSSLHTDEESSKKGIFGKRIAHGLLTLAATEGLWMRLGIFEGTLVAFYGIDRLRFVKPVFIGDTITAKLSVIEKREKENYGILSVKNEVVNQRNEMVLVFDALLLFKLKALLKPSINK